MRRRPRDPRSRLLDRSILLGIISGGLTLALLTGVTFWISLSLYGVDVARTLALVAWLVGGASLGLVMARERRSLALSALRQNLTLPAWVGVAIALAAAVDIQPDLADLLHGSAVPLLPAAVTAGAALVFPFWLELIKRRRTRA